MRVEFFRSFVISKRAKIEKSILLSITLCFSDEVASCVAVDGYRLRQQVVDER